MKYLFAVAVALLLLIHSNTQAQTAAFGLSLSNNVTSFPVTGYPRLFYSQLHPGIEGFYDLKLNKNAKHGLWAGAQVGVFYHRFIQTGVRLYPAIRYVFTPVSRFSLRVGMGAGYLHSFEGYEVFEAAGNGTYEPKKVWKGRSQFLVAVSFGAAYSLKKDKPDGPTLFTEFRTYMQGPFVKSYVPLLPVNAFHAGISFPITNKEQ